jgi:hypothetical protein
MKKPAKPPEVIDATVHSEVEPSPKLVGFLYLLLCDGVPASSLNGMINEVPPEGFEAPGSKYLMKHAEALAKGLVAERLLP